MTVFVFGPVGGFVIAPLCLIAVLVTSRRHTVLFLSSLLMLTWVVSFVMFWYFWGEGFDYADANRPVPPAVDKGQDMSAAVCVLACLGLLVTAIAALTARWREGRLATALPRT
jgi:hypothetical protein